MATKDENVLDEGVEKESVSQRRLSSYREKTLHRLYVRGTEAVRDPWTWDWLKRGTLKKETEGLLTAAQDQALQTNYIRNMIDKQDVSLMCHLCGKREETVSHIATECKKVAQKQYIRTGGTIRLLKLFIRNSVKITICSATEPGRIILQSQ